MRILSIDVGMKHLAFCVFVIQNTERFIVEKWDIVNLCTNNQTNKKCMGTTKRTRYVIESRNSIKITNSTAKYTPKINHSSFLPII